MTKVQTKTLVDLLLDNNVEPNIIRIGPNDYLVRINVRGVSVSIINTVANTLGLTAMVESVEFS